MLGNEMAYVQDCLETGCVSSSGDYLDRFEKTLAGLLGTSHAVSTCNGTAALHLALLALGIGPGQEVLVPGLAYVPCAHAVAYCGAKPVFVDVKLTDWNLDVEQLEPQVTSRTRAIVVVHSYGCPVDLDAISDFAKKHALFLIEDAAQAHGATYQGRPVGSWGDLGTFSFHGSKIVSTGEGGMVVTAHAALAERIRSLKSQGVDPNRRYWFPEIGYNYRMTNIQAALGLAQLETLPRQLREREEIWQGYRSRLEDRFTFQADEKAASPARWLTTVLVPPELGPSRDQIMAQMLSLGVETRPAFTPLHLLPPYRQGRRRSLPVSEEVSTRGISLPTWVGLQPQDLDRVCAALETACLNL